MNTRKYMFLFVFLIAINLTSADIIFNEIMYNPSTAQGSDSYNEWIEIYNTENTTISLENYTLCEKSFLPGYINREDSITYLNNGLIIQPFSYAIITDGGSGTEVYTNFNINENSLALHVDAATLCGGLSGSEKITLKSEIETIDLLRYDSIWGGDNNGFSICTFPNEIGTWKECSITPGQENSQTSSQSYNLIITEFLPNPYGNDNAAMPDGEFIELYNKEETTIDLQGFYLKDSANHKIIISNMNLLNNNTEIEGNSYLTVYTNGFSGFLNNEGLEEIKIYDVNNNRLDKVSYSNSQEGVSWSLIEDSWQQTQPSPNEENINPEEANPARIEIQTIYIGSDEKAKFGDLLRVKIFANKGDDTKESLQLYLQDETGEKISKITRTNLEKKYTDYSMTLPIQIFPNCNEKYPNEKYEIVLEGFDLEDSKKIDIEGITQNLCEQIKPDCKPCATYEEFYSSELSENYESETVINPYSITGNVIFESTGIKSKRYGIYFFCAVLFLVILQLQVKNGKNKS
ncbi:MAG: lamin tail domain-containing protein [Nanoarchaeota archaeon]|nr:lamin tail domain-containing protein [Nanoarchaeota archaeon]MBU1444931.1 lamin tail domain-containing protein [Nanoarchaeota archaeon]MBU2420127.1 lamin tail domain-containing protein [Nanoarchaeota archaeon]MBU2475686.1 lamin tail domain-containing protein [Nanoarchaeota archaeon]